MLVAHWRKGVESLGTGPLAVAPLQVATGHVVERRDTPDHAERIALGHVAGARANDDRDLAFVLRLLGDAGQHDGIAVGDETGWRLEKDQRFGRHVVP